MTGDWQRPSQAPFVYASGNVVVTTDASGNATIGFGKTFPTPPTVTALGGNGEDITMPGTPVTTTSFTAQFKTGTGALIVNGVVRCHWQAFPATT